MPKNKIRKHFMVAADPQGEFFRAYTENKAREVAQNAGRDVYYMQGPLGAMKWHIGAPSNYSLLHQTLPHSESMKQEYAQVVAERFVVDPHKAAAVFRTAREIEKEVRIANLSADKDEEYYDKYGIDSEPFITLEELRALPNSDYRDVPNAHYSVDIAEASALAFKLEEIEHIMGLDLNDAERAQLGEAIAFKLSNIDAKALIHVGDEMDVRYGDREYDEDFDRFEGAPQYGAAYYNVRAAVMKHWDDLNERETNSGDVQKTSAFTVGRRQKMDQAVYVEGDFVRQNAQKITL